MSDLLERDGFTSYSQYLGSPAWKVRRDAALARALNRCQVCNGQEALNVHHRTYERIGRELESDLTVLCRPCHELFHDRQQVREDPRLEQERTKRRERLQRAMTVALHSPNPSGAWDAHLTYLQDQGFRPEELLACGLVERTRSGELIDRYRSCKMAPVELPGGRVVALIGITDEGELIEPLENDLYHVEHGLTAHCRREAIQRLLAA